MRPFKSDNRLTVKQQIVYDALSKHPDVASWTLARMIYQESKGIFNSISAVNSRIRIARNQMTSPNEAQRYPDGYTFQGKFFDQKDSTGKVTCKRATVLVARATQLLQQFPNTTQNAIARILLKEFPESFTARARFFVTKAKILMEHKQ